MKKLSKLDILLLLLLCVGIVGALLRQIPLQTPDEEWASVTLLQKQIPAEVAACFFVGDPLYDEMGNAFGTVQAVIVRPSNITLEQNGVFYTGEWEEGARCDVFLTFSVYGRWREGRFFMEGRTPLAHGSAFSVYTDTATLFGTVKDIHSLPIDGAEEADRR